jgi:NO-binding membrane sensor protein with MHYT domain
MVHALRGDARVSAAGSGAIRLANRARFAAGRSIRTGCGIICREPQENGLTTLGGVFMGSAIAGMHYIGMDAMRLPAICIYSKTIVAVSVTLAIVIAFLALLLTFRFRDSTTSGGWQKAPSAVVMGVAIPVMHYRKNTDAVAEWFCYRGFLGSGNDDWPKT